jgi:hypothetical protein
MKKSIVLVLAVLASTTQQAWTDELTNCVTYNDKSDSRYGQTCCLNRTLHATECHGGNIRPSGPPCPGPAACSVR